MNTKAPPIAVRGNSSPNQKPQHNKRYRATECPVVPAGEEYCRQKRGRYPNQPNHELKRCGKKRLPGRRTGLIGYWWDDVPDWRLLRVLYRLPYGVCHQFRNACLDGAKQESRLISDKLVVCWRAAVSCNHFFNHHISLIVFIERIHAVGADAGHRGEGLCLGKACVSEFS